jgi:predicted nucleic acid-binding protein
VEVSAALVRKANMDKIQREGVRLLLADFRRRIDAGLVDLRRTASSQIARAADIAIDLGHPLKDCVYLTLALEMDCTLLTADARFAERARRVCDRITLLGG